MLVNKKFLYKILNEEKKKAEKDFVASDFKRIGPYQIIESLVYRNKIIQHQAKKFLNKPIKLINPIELKSFRTNILFEQTYFLALKNFGLSKKEIYKLFESVKSLDGILNKRKSQINIKNNRFNLK